MAERKKYMTDISLSPKNLHLVIEALEHRLEWYDVAIQAIENEESIGDLANDRGLLECILSDLKEGREIARRETEKDVQEWKSKQGLT
jgi:hypothetical protein